MKRRIAAGEGLLHENIDLSTRTREDSYLRSLSGTPQELHQ